MANKARTRHLRLLLTPAPKRDIKAQNWGLRIAIFCPARLGAPFSPSEISALNKRQPRKWGGRQPQRRRREAALPRPRSKRERSGRRPSGAPGVIRSRRRRSCWPEGAAGEGSPKPGGFRCCPATQWRRSPAARQRGGRRCAGPAPPTVTYAEERSQPCSEPALEAGGRGLAKQRLNSAVLANHGAFLLHPPRPGSRLPSASASSSGLSVVRGASSPRSSARRPLSSRQERGRRR